MTLIAPSTLIAAQSLTTPAVPAQKAPPAGFRQIGVAELSPRAAAGVAVEISPQARAMLDAEAGATRPAGGTGPAAAPAADRPPAPPPGSTLDISV